MPLSSETQQGTSLKLLPRLADVHTRRCWKTASRAAARAGLRLGHLNGSWRRLHFVFSSVICSSVADIFAVGPRYGHFSSFTLSVTLAPPAPSSQLPQLPQ